MNTTQPCFIVSAEQSSASRVENQLATHLTAKALWKYGIPYKQVLGVYNGVEEQSFVLLDERVAQNIARKYNQECYLYIDSNRYCTLRDMDGNDIKHLGILKNSTCKPNKMAYTKDKDTYYYTE